MIKVENLTKYFETEEVQTIALNKVSMEVKDGEFITIMDPKYLMVKNEQIFQLAMSFSSLLVEYQNLISLWFSG